MDFALPCGTSSRARLIQRKDPWNPPILRTDEFPDGLPHLEGTLAARVEAAKQLYSITCQLVEHCIEHNTYFAVENPGWSFLWQTAPFVQLANQFSMLEVTFHHCRYGSSRRKLTKCMHNVPLFAELELHCDNSRAHEPWGQSLDGHWTTAEETAYPWELCRVIATKIFKQM